MNDFKKYKVQKGDTVESIALKIGMPAADIKAHHNRYSKICDLIEIGLPIRKIEYVLLPNLDKYLEAKLEKKNTVKKVKLEENNGLLLKVRNGLKREYGTTIKYIENNQLKNKIHFTSKIEFLERRKGLHVVKFNVNQVYVNDAKPDLILEELADKTSKILYPVEISLNAKGEIHKILNIESIQNRWQKLKPVLLHYYKGGDVINKLIVSFERNIQSSSSLKRSLLQNPFYEIYFSSIYQNHSSDLSFTDMDSRLRIFQKISEFQTPTTKFYVNRKGKEKSQVLISEPFLSNDKTIETETRKGEMELEKTVFQSGKIEEGNDCNMDFEYKLHHSDNSIFSIAGFINSRKENNSIATMEFETYELIKEKPETDILTPISELIDWNSEIINEKEIEEKGFWDVFFGR